MGMIAEKYCNAIILTNEDPYDEDPGKILNEMQSGMTHKVPEIILDRREAIHRALELSKEKHKPAILITGKGTDPYIMGPNGSKTPWDDRQVAKEEITKFLNT
jgi:UDP-N-acetylmuramoyl-L-alanyl-D-glutamate--2,6-diaminopimelate ligase